MEKNVKAIVVGLGNTGSVIASYAVERGVDILGAVDKNPELVGRHLNEVIQGAPDVIITDDIEGLIKTVSPQIAIVSTVSALEDVAGVVKICLSNGINVITTAEKAFSGKYNKNKELVKELDELAVKNNVTFYASGVQDILWVTFASVLSGLSNNITEIYGENYALIDGFGPFCLEEAFVGKKVEEFAVGEIANDDFNYALSVVAEALDLNIKNEDTVVEPIIAKTDVYSEIADVHVNKGDIIGVLTRTCMETEEGVVLSANFYEKLREEGDTERNYWRVEGMVTLELLTKEMYGEVTTCTTIVNRIVDVINAKPGYLSASDMPVPKYRSKSLGNYINE